jgi:hypothetical protein
MSIDRTRCLWLLRAAIISFSWLPTITFADEFERTHRSEIREMVAASVKMETGIDAMYDGFIGKVRSDPDPNASSLLEERRLSQECSLFIYTKFYAKFRTLIDNIDTTDLSFADFRKDRSDKSIPHDPRKIAFELKYKFLAFPARKDFQPPLDEFVVRYSMRSDLEDKCVHYLDVTEMRK